MPNIPHAYPNDGTEHRIELLSHSLPAISNGSTHQNITKARPRYACKYWHKVRLTLSYAMVSGSLTAMHSSMGIMAHIESTADVCATKSAYGLGSHAIAVHDARLLLG